MSVEVLRTDGTLVGMLTAAYHAKTKRIVLLGEEEKLHDDFQGAYDFVIAPCLDKRDAGFACWSPVSEGIGNLVKPTEYLSDLLMDRKTIPNFVANGVFNRFTAIRSLKEGQDALVTNSSLEFEGIRLGMDLLLQIRHCNQFKRFLSLDKPLTEKTAQKPISREILSDAYRLAREQAAGTAPEPKPRVLLVYSDFTPKDNEAQVRKVYAQDSWHLHTEDASMIAFPYKSEKIPTITELLDYASKYALPEDIIAYANADTGLATAAVERIVSGVARGNGVTLCAKRGVTDNQRAYKTLTDYKMPGGIELIAMTPSWWGRHRDLMPNMFIGREAWDAVFMHLAEEWADGKALPGICDTNLYRTSKAHTDNVCWHVEHESFWANNREDALNKHNQACAREFFAARNKKTIWA